VNCNTTHYRAVSRRSEPYPEALPVLIDVLGDDSYPDNIRAGAASALQRGFAHDAAFDPVVQLYKGTPVNNNSRLKDALANVLLGLSRKDDLSTIFTLVLDVAHGDNRILLLGILKKFPSIQVKQVLTKLLNDPYPHVVTNAQRILSLKSFARL